ncbi:DUF1127 domain-containing protein [Loktanella sp. DJP18]|uniref:DUF1127 domain-containing protein n=1 Tax=Loktanella sp. DJP18 TaxID=3409788 RepID=UPI003BB7C40F
MYTISFFEGLIGQFPRTTVRPARRSGFIKSLIHLNDTWRQSRHIETLPDYLLEDIGLTRGDLNRRRGEW